MPATVRSGCGTGERAPRSGQVPITTRVPRVWSPQPVWRAGHRGSSWDGRRRDRQRSSRRGGAARSGFRAGEGASSAARRGRRNAAGRPAGAREEGGKLTGLDFSKQPRSRREAPGRHPGEGQRPQDHAQDPGHVDYLSQVYGTEEARSTTATPQVAPPRSRWASTASSPPGTRRWSGVPLGSRVMRSRPRARRTARRGVLRPASPRTPPWSSWSTSSAPAPAADPGVEVSHPSGGLATGATGHHCWCSSGSRPPAALSPRWGSAVALVCPGRRDGNWLRCTAPGDPRPRRSRAAQAGAAARRARPSAPYGAGGVEPVSEEPACLPRRRSGSRAQLLDEGRPFAAHEVSRGALEDVPRRGA